MSFSRLLGGPPSISFSLALLSFLWLIALGNAQGAPTEQKELSDAQRTELTAQRDRLWSEAKFQQLMTRFYQNLWQKKMNKLDALRDAQLWMLHEGGKQKADGTRGVADLDAAQPPSSDGQLPPYYWAAFVLSGDWR